MDSTGVFWICVIALAATVPVVAFYAAINLAVFGFEYGPIGWKKRAREPNEPANQLDRNWLRISYFRIAWFATRVRWTYFRWYFVSFNIHESGFGVRLHPWICQIFVPYEYVTKIDYDPAEEIGIIEHNSPDVGSPVALPVHVAQRIELAMACKPFKET